MEERIEKARGRLTICGITRILLIFVLFQVAADVVPQAVRSAFANPSGVNDQSALVGFWVIGKRNWIVQITPCVGGFCGQLVGLSKSSKPDALRTDIHNPDPAKRNRPLCGLILMGGFTQSHYDANKWEGGWVYDPQSGETYAGQMWLDGPNTLRVRGYVFIPLFGRDETFMRETGPINRCSK